MSIMVDELGQRMEYLRIQRDAIRQEMNDVAGMMMTSPDGPQWFLDHRESLNEYQLQKIVDEIVTWYGKDYIPPLWMSKETHEALIQLGMIPSGNGTPPNVPEDGPEPGH